MEMDSATTQELISANDKYVETLQALDDDEKIRHAEQMASTEELTLALHTLSTDYIPWLNEYEYAYRPQMASFTDVEWGNGYDYNYDHAQGLEDFANLVFGLGDVPDYFVKAVNKRLESERNNKVTSDPINTKYAPQTTEYGGKTYSTHFGKNDDAILADYITSSMTPQEILDAMIEKRNNHGGYLSANDYAIAANAETELNRELFNNGQTDQQTTKWNGLLFDLDQADFSQSNKELKDFCDENGGLSEQEAEYFDIYQMYQDKYDTYANLLLSVGVDVTEQLAQLNEELRRGFRTSLSEGDNIADLESVKAKYPAGSIAPANIPHYAAGTKSSKGGLAITDEDGYEAKLRAVQEGRYTLLKEEDMIFSTADTNKLWELVNNPSTFLSDQMKNIASQALSHINNVQNNNDNSVTVHNHFEGDNVFTETINNANEFIDSMTRQASNRWDITNNLKR